jgi:16S rRNA (cytosine967-C5)-methyltransferase
MNPRETALAAALLSARRAIPLRDALAELLPEAAAGRPHHQGTEARRELGAPGVRVAEGAEGSALEARDRALAGEIAFGALRRRITLDLALSAVSSRPVERMQPALAEALRQGAYQLLFLDRVPARAAVSETVEVVKSRMGRGPASFTNACLRSLARGVRKKNAAPEEVDDPRTALASRRGRFTLVADKLLPDPARDEVGWLAASWGYPRRMVARWLARHGPERTRLILEWGNTPPPLSARLNGRRTSAWPLPDAEARLVFEGCRSSEPGEVEGNYVLDPELPPGMLPGFLKGLFTFQDQTQAKPARLLGPGGGARALDLCAGLGGKSCQLAELVGPEGSVLALERDAAKLERAREAASRLGLANIRFLEGDALDPPPGLASAFQFVLLDAPCSNLGALARRPEARFRATSEAVESLAAREVAFLLSAMRLVNPGGALVYSVCSFEEEETRAAVLRALESREDFALECDDLTLPEPPGGAASRGRDGGYCARLRRRRLPSA